MWLMRKINDEGTIHYLISSKKCFTVGRLNSDINLSDTSISRAHCVINIATKKECPFLAQTSCGVWIVDKKSKYGTFILKNHEWVKIELDKVQELSNGSVIRFGLMDNIWRFEYKPLIACASKLSKDQIQELKLLLPSIDGKLINKWAKQCTIVFVNDLTITVKVLLALINGVPIVTINYLRQLVDNVKQNLEWPDYKLFKPEIAESTLIPHLVSLNVEDHRKELFKGKLFFVPNKEQLENLKEIIEAAGGQVQLLDLDENLRKLTEENAIVIQLPCNQLINPDDRTNSFKNLSNKLKHECNMRVVPETEIFQAIAYSSIEKYCNPKSLAFEIRQSMHCPNSCGDIIEEATPSQNTTERRAEENVIRNIENLHQSNSTSNVNFEFSTHRKRKHSPEQESRKKIILEKDKIRGIDRFQIGDDLHIFLNGSNDRELNEGTKESSTPKIVQISKSLMKNNENKQTFLSKLDYTEDFRNCSETKLGKRKMSENCKKTVFDLPQKRKCNTEDLPSSNSFYRERDLNGKASSSVEINKENSFEDKSKTQRHPEFINNTDGKWIRRKNADFRGNCDERDCDELEWINKNTKNFKKKETFKHGPAVNYVEENFEDIGKKLMKEGWHLSRSSRMRTAALS